MEVGKGRSQPLYRLYIRTFYPLFPRSPKPEPLSPLLCEVDNLFAIYPTEPFSRPSLAFDALSEY